MGRFDDAWVEHQCRRWLRPDWRLWVGPDPNRFLKPGVDYPHATERTSAESGKSYRHRSGGDEARRDFERAIAGARAEQAHLRWLLADLKLDLALRRLARKTGFNPDQPRVPAGNPDGGQWTIEGGAGRNDPRVISDAQPDNDWKPGAQYAAQKPRLPGRDRADGHHQLPQAHYRGMKLLDETRKVFDDAKTGRLYIRGHHFDEFHRRYNEATKELLDDYMAQRDIKPERMTPGQAREVLKMIRESDDPRIRSYRETIRSLQRLYRLRSGVRGNE